eukprot:2705564-Amphidinium_carterae.1
MGNGQVRGLKSVLHKSILDFSNTTSNSIDVFASSHVVEHIANPCHFTAGLYRALKPGGIAFTEVPNQYQDPVMGMSRGNLHLLYFGLQAFKD